MAVTQNTYTGNGSTVLFSFTFPYLDDTDIKVSLNGVITTAYTLANATTVQFTTAPANGVAIRIFRQTDDSNLQSTFYPGSAIRSEDLNSNFAQNLYVTQEVNNNAVDIDGSNSMAGNLNLNNYKVVNLGTPTISTDASTKGYVDSVVATGAANAAAAASSASASASSAAAAANTLDAFDDRYLGAKATDPSVDNDGGALIVGAIYFNSTLNQMRVFNGTTWQEASSTSVINRFKFTATGGETSLSGNDDNGRSLTYNLNLELLHLNGALLIRGVDYTATTGSSITGLVALTAGDIVEVVTFSNTNVISSIPSANSTFLQSGSGAVTRTVDSKLKDVVSVKDFGAVGDGVADDTAAIQAAINSGAKSITFPSGTYIVSEALTVLSNQSFFGPGTLKTASVLTGPPDLGFGNTGCAIFINYQKSNLRFEGLSFDMSGTASLPPGAIGGLRAIFLLDCTDIVITGCRSIGKGGFTGLVSCDRYVISHNFVTQTANWADGIIDNWGGWNDEGQHFQITDNNINGSGVAAWGVLVTGTDSGDGLRNFVIANNTVQGALYSGIWVNGRLAINERFSITGNIVHTSGEGIRLSDCKDAVISNNICKSNSYGGISLDSEPGEGTASCENIKVSENLLVDNAVLGGVASLLLSDNTRRCAITGNSIYSATHTSPIKIEDTAYNNSVRNNYYDFAQGEIINTGGFNPISGKLGGYLPTLTGLTNYTTGGVGSARFRVDQGRVHVDMAITLQPTSGASVYTSFGISLPISSNFTAVQDCVGVINGGDKAAGIVQADITNDRATARFYSTDTGNNWYTVSFSYDIK